MNNVYTSGGLNPSDDAAVAYAARAYASIRKQKTDCQNIAANTGISFEYVSLIKAYIFYAKHELLDGIDYFWPCYEMAESWRRLSAKGGRHIQPHDRLLLQHEWLEIHYIMQGMSQIEAHSLACQTFDYPTASNAFYARNLGTQHRSN